MVEVTHISNVTNTKSSHGKVDDMELNQTIAAYESRKMDLRTILGAISLAFTYEAALLSFLLPTAIIFSINKDIGPSGHYGWIATAWTLSSAVVQTVTGRCSDIFGRRNFTLLGNLFALIGCIIGSRASSINVVIVGTTLMGIGSGPQQLSFACVNEIVPKKARGQTLGFLTLAALPGSTFGSVIAYALVANKTWRWAFYVGIIANGWALLLTFMFYWPPGFIGLHPDGKSRLQQFKELDFLGVVLFGGGLGSFVLGVSLGNNPYPWTSANTLAPMVIGAVTLCIAFPVWEVYCPERITKLCPPEVFKNIRGFTLPLVVIFVSGMLLTSLQVLWPQEVQLLFTTHLPTVGWYSLCYNAAATVGAVISGILFARLRRTKWQFLTVTVLQTVFTASMASVDQNTPRRAIGFVIVAAFMVSASQIMGVLIVQFGASDSQIGVATGLTGTIRGTGGAVALAIYGSILNNKVKSNLISDVAAAAFSAGLAPSSLQPFILALTSGSTTALSAVTGITPTIIAAGADAIKSVYASAFRLIFLVSMVFGGISIIAVLFIRSVDDALTSQIVVQLEKPRYLPGLVISETMATKEIDV